MQGRVERRRGIQKPPDQLILHGWVRFDGLGITLFMVSAMGVLLNGVLFPRLGRTGGILQQISTGILFGREIRFVSADAHRQRPLPRLLTFMELVSDGLATVGGFWAWVGGPWLNRLATRLAWTRYGRSGSAPHAVTVSRAAAVISFILHTLRLAIYLTPGRGLRESSGD